MSDKHSEAQNEPIFSEKEYRIMVKSIKKEIKDLETIILKLAKAAFEKPDKNMTGQFNKAKRNAVNKLRALRKYVPDIRRQLERESDFKPAQMVLKRGDIVYNKFGWNPGNELVDDHYALVIQNNLDKKDGTVVLIPLTSLKEGDKEVYDGNVELGDLGLNDKGKISIARVEQLKSQHKLRVKNDSTKPFKCGEFKDEEKLYIIDQKIRDLFTKEWYALGSLSKKTDVPVEAIQEMLAHPLYSKLLRVKKEGSGEKSTLLFGQECVRIVREIYNWEEREKWLKEQVDSAQESGNLKKMAN